MNCNSLVNTDSFYTKFTNTTFQKVHIPHLTHTYYEIGVKWKYEVTVINLFNTNLVNMIFFPEPKVALTKELVYLQIEW